jgi:hypothetical protein
MKTTKRKLKIDQRSKSKLTKEEQILSVLVKSAVKYIPPTYIVVKWPESQMIMEKSWFRDECILIDNDHGYKTHGDSAYLVPKERYDKL